MTQETIINIGSDAIKTTVLLAGPLLAAAMATGLIVSILQAVTQINESTLTFIPKMVAVLLVLTVMAPWMIDVLQQYTTGIFGNLGEWAK